MGSEADVSGLNTKSAVKIRNNVPNSVLAIAPIIQTSDQVTGWHLKSDKQPKSLCLLRGAKKKEKKEEQQLGGALKHTRRSGERNTQRRSRG